MCRTDEHCWMGVNVAVVMVMVMVLAMAILGRWRWRLFKVCDKDVASLPSPSSGRCVYVVSPFVQS